MQPGTCQRVSAPPAQQTTTKFEQITQSQLAIAVLIEQAAQQVATGRALALGAGTLLTEHLPQAAGVHAARAHALGQKGHDDGRQHLHQLAGVCPQAAGLAQPGFGTLASTAKNMPQDGSAGTTAHRSTGRCVGTEHGAKQAAQIHAAQAQCLLRRRIHVVALQGAEQRLRALLVLGVAAQGAEQQRQGHFHRALRLCLVGTQLLGHLLQGRALQVLHQLLGQQGGGCGGVHDRLLLCKVNGISDSDPTVHGMRYPKPDMRQGPAKQPSLTIARGRGE